MDQPPDDFPVSPSPRRRRFVLWRVFVLGRAHRRWRWLMRIVGAATLIFVAAIVLLTHSPLTKRLIIPRLEAICGMQIEADWVHIRRSGDVIVDNARVSIPGVPGEAGRFLKIARVQAGVDWWSTIKGAPRITGVTIVDPVMIVSQSTVDGSLNIGSVPIPAQTGGNMLVPGITITNLGLEIGEHDQNSYHALKRIQMDGALTPVADKPGAFDVHLQETTRKSAARSRPGFNLDGTVTEGQIELNLVNFSLSDWPASTMPSSIREISEKLAVTGQVPTTHFTYNRKEGSTARMELRGVAMNLPVEAEVMGPVAPGDDQPAASKWMRMSGVNGSITFARNSVTAKVGGLIEDLPYRVSLRYDGVDENSPFNLDFVSEGFPLDKNPSLLVYAPPMVKYYLKEVFLKPTGIVTTNLNVKRGLPIPAQGDQPAQAGPITVSGSVDFHDGTAAYEGFPYEFQQLEGRFEFDNDQINIIRVAGVSPTGARLLAKGRIAPLDETSEVHITIDVSNAQIDEAMQAAFGEERSKVLTAVFNEAKHKELRDAGLIRTPQDAETEAKELEKLLSAAPLDAAAAARAQVLRDREKIPVFSFRGSADVSIDILSPRGVNAPYLTSVDIHLPSVGLIPEKFPYPIVASDVMVEIRNTEGHLTWGNFKGVNGGRADIEASFKVPGKFDPDPQVRPEITIGLTDMPMDELIIHALPGPPDGSVKRILTQLGVSGAGSGTVRIAPRGERGDADLGFDADIDITSAEANPKPFKGSDVIALTGITGHFETSESKLFLDLDGTPVRPPQTAGTVGPGTPLSAGERVGGTLTVHVRGEFPPASSQDSASFFVSSTCPNFELASPFESIVGVFSEKAGDAVNRARAEYNPSGFVDVRTVVESNPGQDLRLNVDLTDGRALAANALGGKLVIPESSGKVSLVMGDEKGASPHVRIDSVSGAIIFADQPAGIASIDGSLPMGEAPPGDASSLEVTLLDARLDSSLTRSILEQKLGADAMSMYRRVDPSGLFDATIIVRPDRDPKATGLTAQGTIEPRTLTLRIGDRPVEFATVSGAIEFEPGSGVLRELSLQAPEWSAKADGGWTLSPQGAVTFSSALTARGNKLSDDLRAVLPPELRSLFQDLKLKLSGPFKLTDATLDLTRDPGDSGPKSAAQFSGRLDFAGAELEAGVPVTDMNGALLVRFDNSRGMPDFRLDLKADRFEVAGVTLTSGRAVIQSGSEPGRVRIPEASGFCHGGRFAVRADVEPIGPEENAPRRFHADFQFGGVRFSSLLRELIDSVKPFVGPPSPPEADADAETTPAVASKDDFSRGLMDGELTIEGLVSDPDSRRGRGMARVCGGRVLNLPVVTALIEASNLQFPFNSKLDFAQAKFFVEGGLITFEDLSVQSRAIELIGKGTMTWPERWLDLRFISRAARPIPIISNIIQGIRNQLIVTTVTGKLGEQVMSLQTPGPTRMLEGAGGRESRQSQDRADAERKAAANRERDRRRGRGIGPELPPREDETAGVKEP